MQNGRNRHHLIPYIGNKSGFAHIFDCLIPDSASSRRIYDVFGGGASFSIYASYRFASKNVTYNDNNPTVTSLLQFVKDDPRGLAQQYLGRRQRSSEQHYLDVRQMSLDDGLAGAGRFLYLAKSAFSGKIRFSSSNRFNSPMRKRSKCPRLDLGGLLETSRTIRDMKTTNHHYGHYEDVSGGFLYLDPPYLGNRNNHYNGVPRTDEFIGFVKNIEDENMVMISEQNRPQDLALSEGYTVFDVFLGRSLQYFTRSDSREIVAINYDIQQKAAGDAVMIPV